ncbi:MAG: VUT family protein [Deltaproteobacteria bacterium]|nr:VUT family protein [Deltaproteobacteria bacterium]
MNELLWIGFALADLTLVLIIFRLFGRAGLLVTVVFSLLMCNIQVLKTVELFGLTTTLGNVLYASIFLATDLLGEHYGKKAAQQAVLLGFVALVVSTIYMQVALLFTPAVGDFAQSHLEVIFGFMPRVALASMCAYLASQWHDVWAFHFIKTKTAGRHLWLRNTGSTVVSQMMDSLIFCAIAFWGVFPLEIWLEILLSTYVLKFLMSLMDTPFMYLAQRLVPQT